LVVAERLEKLATPDVLEHTPVLSNLLTQGQKPLARFQKLQLPLWLDEAHDTSPVEQHERPFDRVIAHERAWPLARCEPNRAAGRRKATGFPLRDVI
jgi:hypothetical protein